MTADARRWRTDDSPCCVPEEHSVSSVPYIAWVVSCELGLANFVSSLSQQKRHGGFQSWRCPGERRSRLGAGAHPTEPRFKCRTSPGILGSTEYASSRTGFGSVGSVDSSTLDNGSFLTSVVLRFFLHAVHSRTPRNAAPTMHENSRVRCNFQASAVEHQLLRLMCLQRCHSHAATELKHASRAPKPRVRLLDPRLRSRRDMAVWRHGGRNATRIGPTPRS